MKFEEFSYRVSLPPVHPERAGRFSRCTSGRLAAAITKSASKQAYYTIRLFADRDRVADAYRAYGYFRWLDDVIDAGSGSTADRSAFVGRQQSILESCYRGVFPTDLCAEEWMLVDLISNDTEQNSGLQAYLRSMMDVMAFDTGRRGRVVSQAELFQYSQKLAKAVTEAMFHFIGHDEPCPAREDRYLAVTAAHITHMLRDAHEDAGVGYFNIPREILLAHGIHPEDVESAAYRDWVRGRVRLARDYFKRGREYIAQVRNWRCRLAGYAYVARFEWMLDVIERENYCLRAEYPERKSLRTGLWLIWSTMASMLAWLRRKAAPRKLAPQPVRVDK
jgi:phytoene/squalene synthetase